jgi:hypothetical protein
MMHNHLLEVTLEEQSSVALSVPNQGKLILFLEHDLLIFPNTESCH